MAKILAIDDELDMLILIKNILIKGDHIVDIYQTTADIDENSLGKYDLTQIIHERSNISSLRLGFCF